MWERLEAALVVGVATYGVLTFLGILWQDARRRWKE